MSARNLIR